MTLETKQFNLTAVSIGITLLVYLGGALFALVTQQIGFSEFLAAVGTPLGGMTGWVAHSYKATQP
jgi:hypothetical protein